MAIASSESRPSRGSTARGRPCRRGRGRSGRCGRSKAGGEAGVRLDRGPVLRRERGRVTTQLAPTQATLGKARNRPHCRGVMPPVVQKLTCANGPAKDLITAGAERRGREEFEPIEAMVERHHDLGRGRRARQIGKAARFGVLQKRGREAGRHEEARAGIHGRRQIVRLEQGPGADRDLGHLPARPRGSRRARPACAG